MFRYSFYLMFGTLWTLLTSLMVVKIADPFLELYGPGSLLALGLAMGTWIVFVLTLSGSLALKRVAQVANFSIPLVWVLWVSNLDNLSFSLATWMTVGLISFVGNALQEPGLGLALSQDGPPERDVRDSLMEAVRPVISPTPALDTGSVRLPS